MRKVIQIFEWETLKVGDSCEGLEFKQKHFNSLCLWSDKQKKSFFKIGHKKITFSQWVGVIQVGSLVIEVLPKAGNSNIGREQEIIRWKGVLIGMLRKTKKLKLRTSEDTDLAIRRQSLFDLYYQSFNEEVETLLHRGLVKKYRKEERNRTALKGKLNFQKQTSLNLVHKERFYTEAFEYDRQNDWNEILLAALRVASRQAQSGLIRSKSKSLELSFPDWPQKYFKKSHFDKLKYDRKTEGYSKAIALAKLILLYFNPQINTGQEKVLAIFFDMNRLWEDWLLAMYQSSYRNDKHISIIGKKRKTLWASNQTLNKTIETDILIKKNGNNIILDAKWKKPGSTPSDSDLKQMYVYNTMWESNEAWLVYPQVDGRENIEGDFTYTLAGKMGMTFVKIFGEDNRLVKKLSLPICNKETS